MSAYIVGKEHINALAAAICQLDPRDNYGLHVEQGRWSDRFRSGDESKVALILVQENHRSYNHRYAHRNDFKPTIPETYRARSPKYKYTILELLKALQCYEYQACECPDWHETHAYAICLAFKDVLISRLPGYDQVAGWSLDGTDPALKRPQSFDPERAKLLADTITRQDKKIAELLQTATEREAEVHMLRNKLRSIAASACAAAEDRVTP